MKKITVSLILAGTAALNAAWAANYPQAYDATFETTVQGAGTSKMHTTSDGKGHLRTETEMKGNKTTSIMDYPSKTVTTLMDAQKMYMKMAFKEDQAQITDQESAKRLNAKSLGTKVINGHPCHGFERSQSGAVSQYWIGDDTHCLVHQETTSPTSHSVTDLKTWSAKVPAISLDVPSGYKELKMPGQQ